VKQHSILKRVQFAGGAGLRAEVSDYVHEAAAQLQKRVCERAQELEPSGDPADVIAYSTSRSADFRETCPRDCNQFFTSDAPLRTRFAAARSRPKEIDRHIAEAQPYIAISELTPSRSPAIATKAKIPMHEIETSRHRRRQGDPQRDQHSPSTRARSTPRPHPRRHPNPSHRAASHPPRPNVPHAGPPRRPPL
jgi:hypothetical protein